jgi:uncharacterized protein YlaI
MRRKPWATLVCQHCGARFSVQPSRARTAKFCGKACFGRFNTGRKRLATIHQESA